MNDRFSLVGKTALITGAGSGLGAHFSHTLGEAGATVLLAGRRIAPLERLKASLSDKQITAHALQMDVTTPSSVAEAFDHAEVCAGTVHIVVCCAGIAVNKRSLDLDIDDWDSVIDTNLRGCWLVCKEAARRLIAVGSPGSLINISSILGHRVAGSVLPYTVAKAGVEQMTRALALEWARHGIRVNALAPGYVETDLNREFFVSDAGKALIQRVPQRRLGQPTDLDGVLLLLASDASTYMTGTSVVVDGGHLQSSL